MCNIHCSWIVLIILLIILTLYCKSCDGFRTKEQKRDIANHLFNSGKPKYKLFKDMGLDGVEYYDAKQLWKRNMYNADNIINIL